MHSLATSSGFFLSLKSKACRLALLDHSLEEASGRKCRLGRKCTSKKQNGNSEGEGGSRLWNSEGMGEGGGGVMHFGISEGEGSGLKHGSRLWLTLSMDIFWNCPFHFPIDFYRISSRGSQLMCQMKVS